VRFLTAARRSAFSEARIKVLESKIVELERRVRSNSEENCFKGQ
jgi:hypothetical protein